MRYGMRDAMEMLEAIPLMHLLGLVTSLPGITIICSAIILWALVARYKFKRRMEPLIRDFRECVQKLKNTDGEGEFAEYFAELGETFERSRVLNHTWAEFSETLIFPDMDSDSGDTPTIRNTAAPDRYFNRQSLLEPRVNLRIYNALPNLLTGTGILGTFVGLVIGIGQASQGLAAEDVGQAQQALSALLSGAALAFMTSIVGLVSSIAFSSWEKRKVHQFDQLCNEWVEALDARLSRVTQEGLTDESLRELKQQRAALEHFSNDLAFQISEALDERVTSKLTPVLERVVHEIEGMRSEQRQASDETLERLMREFSESISSAAGEEMKAFAGTVQQMGQSLEQQVQAMSSSHVEMQAASQRTIQELSDTFRESSRQLNEELSSAVRGLVTEISQTVAEMTRELRAATETTTTNMNEIVERFDESVAKLRQSIADIREMTSNTQALNEKMRQLLESVDASHKALAEVKEPLETAGQRFQETGSRVEGAAGGISTAMQKVSDAADQLSRTQSQTTDIWKSYEDRFQRVDESLDKVFEQLQEGLSGYADSTNRYVQGLDEHATKVVEQLAGAVRQLEEAIEEFNSYANERA